MFKRITIAVAVFLGLTGNSQDVNIFPRPQSITKEKDSFVITPATVIVMQGTGLDASASFLNEYLQKFYGFTLTISKKAKARQNAIVLNYERMDHPVPGAYNLQVTNDGVYIAGDNKEGVFYGIQSLIQLLPPEKKTELIIAGLSIKDAPSFGYRGLHLDVSRHFMPVSFIKSYIDYIALFKLNTFHWHLTDDQGWRIEIKKYPKLTETGGWRDGTIIGHFPGTGNDNQRTGGYYTQEQVKEVVQYAADRMITVIPEIEMPGHASAAIAAYPFLSCFPNEKTNVPGPASAAAIERQEKGVNKIVQETWGIFPDVFVPNEQTFGFLKDVLTEVIALFPSKYIHIGGDECPKEFWKRSAFCQQLIKEKGLKDEHGLQSYFIETMEKFLNSKGRKIIGWDEILEGGLAPNATVMSWRGEKGGIEAAQQNHDVVMTPGEYCYFDHSETKNEDSLTIGGYLPMETVYGYNPVPAALSGDQSKHILGAQANVWTEYMESPAKVEYMIFPRLAALSEVVWTGTENKNYAGFKDRLPALKSLLDFMKVNYNQNTLGGNQ